MNWAEKSLAERERVLAEMTPYQRLHWEEAEFEEMQPTYEEPRTWLLDIGGFKTVEIATGEEGLRCTKWEKGPAFPGKSRKLTYIQCHRPAGSGTDHEGVGLCYMHDGARGRGRAQGAILMAHAFGNELNVSPWQALLQQVRLLAGQVAWLQARVNEAEAVESHAAFLPTGTGAWWATLLDQRGERLVKASKAAIDAGVAERLVRQVELEGELMYRAATHMLDTLDLTPDQRELALRAMAGKLLELESTENNILQGVVV